MKDPTSARGAERLLDVLDEAGRHGYTVQQIAHADGPIECMACDVTTSSKDFDVEHVRRLEGASDAADLLVVVWSPCPNCAERGVLILGHGPNATADDVAVLDELDLTHADPSPTDDGPGLDDPPS